MNVTITSRHLELTDSIKDYILRLSQSLEKYNLDILSTRVVISYQEKKGKEKKKRSYTIDITLSIAKANTVVISQKDNV